MSKITCASCRHQIDASAKVCPYCGADPGTGQKVVDTSAMLQEMFKPRRISAGESVLEYARQRQGVVIAVSAVVLFLILAGLHQYVTMRNDREVSTAPAVALTEVTDISQQQDETKPVPMPEMPFQYEGRPQAMRSFIVEAGAVTPPEVIAEQQAAAQAAAAKQQAQQPKPAGTTTTPPPTPPPATPAPAHPPA